MSIVSVQEQFQPSRYLVISNLSNSQEISTTRVLVSDLRTNSINLVTIEKGPAGDTGPQGPKGEPGKDGLIFDVLPITSGGTNNTNFSTNYLISYDGNKLISSPYTVNDIVNLSNATNNSITGIIAGSGLQRTIGSNNTSILDVKIGDGLRISNSTIVVDDSVVRSTGVNISQLIGTLPISKGGTNNSSYSVNRLIYYNGSSFSSFPLNTGNIVVSGSAINIIAGSGLIGGGQTTIPNGTVVLEIGSSSDILVEENSIALTPTGSPGTYTKITTDDKGRVISGSLLTIQDIISLLGYTPWHAGNDGELSGLDADLLDGKHGSFYQNSSNLSGTLNLDRLPNLHSEPRTGTKFLINTKGLIEESYFADSQDIISSLGYRPLNAETDDTKLGSLNIIGNLITSDGDVSIYDNLPLLGTNRPNILPSEPRGFTFNYGGSFTNKTGILAYYPTDNQLRLITNIFGSGSNIDANDINQDDINGGDAQSIYIIENLQGDTSTVLFREIADQLYINTNTSQTIYGFKRFLADLEVVSQLRILGDNATPTRPPLSVGNNNLLVTNLNADLLDDQHGSYYRNATNITGSFSYNNVTFNHIEGENNFIPKFTDPANPSRKITSSNILQRSNGDIEISNERNLIVGLDDNVVDSASINTLTVGENNLTSSENSISIGQHNILAGFNSATIGTRNIASGDNSIAANLGSVTRSDQSIALGSYGITEVANQLAFGAFRTVSSGNQILEHGQYSTIAAYLRGTETDGNWRSMTPVIDLPKDKTIAFNIELLINKGLSSGVGHFLFESGIINNATYRNPLNITQILNSTTVPNSGTKIEVFNNSQLRRHYHFWNYTNPVRPQSPTRIGQYINCLDPPNRELDISMRHLPTYHMYVPTYAQISGTFEKTFDGNLILDVSKPRYSGVFTQSFTSPHISIYSKNHGVVPDSEVDIEFVNTSRYFIAKNRYKALATTDDSFVVSAPAWTGIKQTLYGETKIYIQNFNKYDKLFAFDFIGSINNNVITIPNNLFNSSNYKLNQIIKTNMHIKLIDLDSGLAYHRIVDYMYNNEIFINHPIYTDTFTPTLINGNIRVIIDNYSFFVYKECDSLYINSEFHTIKDAKSLNSAQFFPDTRFSFVEDQGAGTSIDPSLAMLYSNQNGSIEISIDDLDQNGIVDLDDIVMGVGSNSLGNESFIFSISVPYTITNIPDGSVVSIRPIFNSNSGTLNLYHKNTYDCTYNATYSNLNKHSGCYIRWKDNSNYHRISIFDSGNMPINFISNPPSFKLSNGYLSDNNKFFDIRQSGNRYFLYANKAFDYESNNLIPIRVKASSYKSNTTSDFEKILYVYIQNKKENPLVSKPINNFSIYANDIFEYSVPNDTFFDSDVGELEYSAEIKGGHSLPRWLVFDNQTISFSGIPDICDIGAYSIDLTATDKDGLQATDNFIIEVANNPVLSAEVFAYDVSNILSTQNIFLTQNHLIENAPPSTLVGELRHVGGYNPYLTFLTAENNFSGTFNKSSDIITKCKPILQHYIPASISGSPEFISVYSNVSLKDHLNNTLGSGYKVKNIYKPTIFSGTPINNGKIIFDNTNFDYSVSTLFENQLLPMRNVNPSFGSRMRISSFNDYSATLANGLLQDKRGSELDLILTENNEVINHNIDNFLISYYIEEEDRFNDLCVENETDKLTYTDYHEYSNITWSTKNMYSWLFTESEESNLVPENISQNLQSENISNLESIYHPPTYTNIELLTENYEQINDESYFALTANIVDYVWYSDGPVKIYRQFHNDIDKSFIDNKNPNYPPNPLQQLRYKNDTVGLLQSNIDYKRDNNQLSYAHDYWYFDKELNNTVLYVDKIGSDDNAHFITEQRAYTGVYISSSPYEYGLLITEDGHGIISNTKTHHGSRIELSDRYEILESINVFNDNGKIFLDTSIDTLLCENNDLIVHDYAISAKSGTAYILFPGKNNQIKINYPSRASFSANRIGYSQQGYYEDQLPLLPNNLRFTEPNFFYTWGKLIPYRLYTDEYAIRLDSIYSGVSQNGKICYSGDIPDSGHYFPEIFQIHNFTSYTGICPSPALSGGINGFGIRENYNTNAEYVTGLVTFYTDITSSNISISSLNDEFNLDQRNTDYVRIYNPITSSYNAQLPRVGTYFDIEILSNKSFAIENWFLYPSTYNITHSGYITVNLDRNHSHKSYNPKIVNRIPIVFDTVYNSNQDRLPKNNFFDIDSISGNKIYVKDDKNYLLREINYPDYFDHSIRASYLTNGCSFLGSLFHNNHKIYDIRPNLNLFDQVYEKATFEFDKNKKELAINLPTGLIKIFDNIELFNFAALSPYMIFDISKIYHTGFTVLEQNISIRNIDSTPEQDFILMERSPTVLAPDNIQRLTFNSDIFNNSVSGTCTISSKLANRLSTGYLLNYKDNIFNQSGHQILSIQDGYKLSGVIPRNHNILSSTGIILDDRLGFSSIVSTGSPILLSGLKTDRIVGSNDIGYTEFYKINATGFLSNNLLSSGIYGKGTISWPYKIFIDTSGSNTNTRLVEFLYLGHNSNTLNFYGTLSTSGSIGDLSITQITLSEQLHIEHLKRFGIVSGVTPVIDTGTLGYEENINWSIPVNRYDIIQLRINPNNMPSGNNACYLYSYMQDPADPLPLKLDDKILVNTGIPYFPEYRNIEQTLFHILPTISTTVKYCNINNPYNKNNNIFYNGNIIHLTRLDSIKSFLNQNDHIKLQKINNIDIIGGSHINKINSTNETTSITGISIDGLLAIPPNQYVYANKDLLEDTYRHVDVFSTGINTQTPISGYIDFVGSNSGLFNLIDYNNLISQSHGGSTARWPQDTDGHLVPPIFTGIYSVVDNGTSACTSGRLCVSISGYKNTQLSQQILFDKYYYFDFIDGMPSLSNIYKIKDKLSDTKISINVPYDISLNNKSGIVYIIDSFFNIKPHLSPNLNNAFVRNVATLSNPDNINLVKHTIHAFDDNTKKWNHIFHLPQTLPAFSSYPISVSIGSALQSGNIVNYPEIPKIGIRDVSVLKNRDFAIFDVVTNNMSAYTDTDALTVRVRISGGVPPLNSNISINTPKIFISGVAEYNFLYFDSLYGYKTSGWDIGINIYPFKNTGVFPIAIGVFDEAGSDYKHLNLNITERPRVLATYPTGYASVTSSHWKLYFDVKGIDLGINNPNDQGLFIYGSPNDLNYDITRRSSSELEIIGYPAGGGFSTGIWNPIVLINDFNSGQIIASGSGSLHILPSLNDRPQYIPYINNLNTNNYINLAKGENISFQIPVYEEPDQQHSAVFTSINGGVYFGTTRTFASFDSESNRYKIVYLPTNTGNISYLSETAYAADRPVNFTVSQPIYNNGNRIWDSYTSENYLTNFTFFRPLLIDTTLTNTVPEFEINKPWVYEFAITEGVCKHRPNNPPRVTLFNTPSIGSVIHQYLSYSISYKYDALNKIWIVTAQGKPDIYGKYAPSTGTYVIDIFADDTYGSYGRSSFSIKYIPTNSIEYVLPNLYNTPNNEFFIQADIKESNSGIYPNITFDGENTIDMDYSTMYKKYNKDLHIWEVAGTGNKFVQKWDSRILINQTSSNPSITLQCKGIATDKITAVAKVNLLELQNTNRDIIIDQAKPIKISGIKNYTNPESGIIVKQGTEPWTLEFDTIFGLESALHPPTIILQNTPTFCTGYDPRLDPKYGNVIDPNLQNPCLSSSSPSFNSELKTWHFVFSGVPSCLLLGPLPFSITAIDTNLVLENPYIEPADIVETLFTYTPIDTPHPKPVVEDAQSNQTQLELKPLCNTLYYRKLKFGPQAREECPQPTGLTGIIISGSLPSGLNYTINYPSYLLDNPFNAPLYNNLQSGEVIIQGYPLSFATNGNTYDETFGIIVVDARNNSGSQVITFDQSVPINDPNISIAVYFDSDKPVFTPSTGLQIMPMQGMYRWRPEPIIDELECNSILPNNTCPAKVIPYSGQQEPDTLLFLMIDNPNDFGIMSEDLVVNNEVYIRINQDPNNLNNGRYRLKRTTSTTPGSPVPSNLWYVNTKEGFQPRTGLVDIVIGNYKFQNIQDITNLFNGDIQYNFGCLLGNGSIGNDIFNNKLGIKGYLSPGFSGYVPTNGWWKSNDVRLTGLQFTNIDSSNTSTNIAYTNCWETGYLRISGIILPRPYIEITDPPPATNNNFSWDGASFGLSTRLAFGNTDIERGLSNNSRDGIRKYLLTNLYTHQIGLSGSQSERIIDLPSNILTNAADGTGTVFRLDIESPSNASFPTFDVQARSNAIPSTYFWVHKATPTLITIPSQSSLPPIIPCLPQYISITSGVIIDNISESNYGIDGVAYGGYIPHNICSPSPDPTACPENDLFYTSGGSPWLAKDYLPTISGIILQSVNIKNNFKTTAGYNSSAQTFSMPNINNILSEGDLISLTVTKIEWNGNITFIDSFVSQLSSANIVDNNVVFYNKTYSNIGQSELMIDVKFVNQIKDIDTINNLITVYHNNLTLSINDNVAMSSISESTSLNAIDTPGVPYITTIDNTGLAISTNLYNNFNIGDYVSIYKIIEDNIKIMPYNILSNKEGIYDFKISGRANILYGDYFYRIMTKENINMPIFSNISTNITPKKYEKDIPMIVSKPLKILSSNVIWPSTSNSWTVTLEVDGGRLPSLSETIDVRIDLDDTENYGRCGFRRFPINKDKDIFNSVNNTTIITLSSIPNTVDWGNQFAFRIMVSDSTGTDTVLILKDTT